MNDYEKKILNDIKNDRATLNEQIKTNTRFVTTARKKLEDMDRLIAKLESKDI